MKHKFSVLAYDNIITGDIKGAFKKMANEWKFLPGPTQQKQKPAVTEESLMIGVIKISYLLLMKLFIIKGIPMVIKVKIDLVEVILHHE